jgi:hypothetical protein
MAEDSNPRGNGGPWYAAGLRFACQACGRCCGGAPGFVWVQEDDLRAIAAHVGLDAAEFRRLYVRRTWRGMTLREKANYDCVMLDGGGRCLAYPVRPVQCRTWPFWPTNLRSAESWADARRRCPGIGQGPLYSLQEIEALRMEMLV